MVSCASVYWTEEYIPDSGIVWQALSTTATAASAATAVARIRGRVRVLRFRSSRSTACSSEWRCAGSPLGATKPQVTWA